MKKKFRKNILLIFHTYAYSWKLEISTFYGFFFILFFQIIKTKSYYNANSPYSVPKSVNETQRKVKWSTFCGWKVNKIFFMNFFFILFSLVVQISVSNKSYKCVDSIHTYKRNSQKLLFWVFSSHFICVLHSLPPCNLIL